MILLLKNGYIINVFSERTYKADVLIENEKIIGVGEYSNYPADKIIDCTERFICPGFIDGHMHIESTMLLPFQLARTTLPHGTVGIVADPHEIANVLGLKGIEYMLQATKDLPLSFYFMIPSCVPSTIFDESYTSLKAENIHYLYHNPRVLGLAEMMNFPGVINRDPSVLQKIEEALSLNRIVDGHAPTLNKNGLDSYISSGISSDHECSTAEEAKEKLEKGQWIMIREGTAARNLNVLLPLFDAPWYTRCLLVTDDRHPSDLQQEGHIDQIIRKAIKAGKSPERAIRMASLQAAERFELKQHGAIAPGYYADMLILNDLKKLDIRDVYVKGKLVVENGNLKEFNEPVIEEDLRNTVMHSVHVKPFCGSEFNVQVPSKIKDKSNVPCRIIRILKGELITEEIRENLDFTKNNGICVERDILKIAVIERHHATGHIGLGYINGIHLKRGAIASTVSHDSHNIIVIGTNDADMMYAVERIMIMEGGCTFVVDKKIIAEEPLPVAGLMSDLNAEKITVQNKTLRELIKNYGVPEGIEPFMNMAFVSLPVIPYLKITTMGLIDVRNQKQVDLFL